MPQAIVKTPDPYADSFLPFSSYLQGKVEAAPLIEQKRAARANEQLQAASLQEQRRQWNGDNEFNYLQLQEANLQGKLNREQQERLAIMATKRSEMQQLSDQEFQAKMEGARESHDYFMDTQKKKFEADQNAKQRAVERYQIGAQYDLGLKNVQSRNAEMDLNRQQLNTQGRLLDVVETSLAGADPSKLTPEQRQSVEAQVVTAILGESRVTGDPNVVAMATDQEKQLALNQARTLINNYTNHRAKYDNDRIRLATKEAEAAKAGEISAVKGNGKTSGSSLQVGYGTPVIDLSAPDPEQGWEQSSYDSFVTATGVRPLDGKAMGLSQTDMSDNDRICYYIVLANADIVASGYDQRVAMAKYEATKLVIDNYIKKMDRSDLGDYYDTMLKNATFGALKAYEGQ